MSKVEFGVEFVCDSFVIGKLFSIVRGEGVHPIRERSQKINNRFCDTPSSFAFDISAVR
jgi:hypothetical protein